MHRANEPPVLNVSITGANSPVCYNMLSFLSNGDIFGPDVIMNVHFYDRYYNQCGELLQSWSSINISVTAACSGRNHFWSGEGDFVVWSCRHFLNRSPNTLSSFCTNCIRPVAFFIDFLSPDNR